MDRCDECGKTLGWIEVAFGRAGYPVCGGCLKMMRAAFQCAKRGCHPANARFWTWDKAGWVRLTLRPGQQLHVIYGGPNEEGYIHGVTQYTHTGDGVRCDWHEHGRDCDGRFERGGESFCPLDQLRAKSMEWEGAPSENAGILAPEWQKLNAHQRDHAAEAAGY